MKKNLAFAFTALLALVVLVGCEKRPEGLPALYPTEITVMCDGKPVPNATINVLPENQINYVITGKTDEKGIAEPRANFPTGSYVGLPLGKASIRISKEVNIGTEDKPQMVNTIDTHYNSAAAEQTLEVNNGKNKATFTVEADSENGDRIFE